MQHHTRSAALPPTVHDRARILFDRETLSPQGRRVLQYILYNPGAATHEIAHNAGCSYPPSTVQRLAVQLAGVGLRIEKTRTGLPTDVCTWRLRKLEQ